MKGTTQECANKEKQKVNVRNSNAMKTQFSLKNHKKKIKINRESNSLSVSLFLFLTRTHESMGHCTTCSAVNSLHQIYCLCFLRRLLWYRIHYFDYFFADESRGRFIKTVIREFGVSKAIRTSSKKV